MGNTGFLFALFCSWLLVLLPGTCFRQSQENKNLAVFVIDSQGVISVLASFQIGSEIFFFFFFTHFHGDLPLCSELPFITGDPCGEPHLLQSAHVHECSNDPLITRIHSSLGGVKPPAYVCVWAQVPVTYVHAACV